MPALIPHPEQSSIHAEKAHAYKLGHSASFKHPTVLLRGSVQPCANRPSACFVFWCSLLGRDPVQLLPPQAPGSELFDESVQVDMPFVPAPDVLSVSLPDGFEDKLPHLNTSAQEVSGISAPELHLGFSLGLLSEALNLPAPELICGSRPTLGPLLSLQASAEFLYVFQALPQAFDKAPCGLMDCHYLRSESSGSP